MRFNNNRNSFFTFIPTDLVLENYLKHYFKLTQMLYFTVKRMFQIRGRRKNRYAVLICLSCILMYYLIRQRENQKESFSIELKSEKLNSDSNHVTREISKKVTSPVSKTIHKGGDEEEDTKEEFDEEQLEAEVALKAAELNVIVKSFYKDIFRPSDAKIKMYNGHKNDKAFKQSLVNESRVEDSLPKDFPLSPEEAIQRFGTKLPYWEKYEILNYPEVYYLGLNANKSQLNENGDNNFGFDFDTKVEKETEGNYDVSGHYKMVPGDHIGYRYEIIKYIDTGYYCDVIIARDWSNPTLKNVAIKIIRIDNDIDWTYWREVQMFQYIESHASNLDYFTRMLATFKFRNHLCMVLELLGGNIDLKYLKGPVRNMTLARRFASDALHGLSILKEIGVVHRDFKPHNLMYIHGKNEKSSGQLIKIGDFGGSCVLGKSACGTASYIMTRRYRAPEVTLALGHTTQADIFSFGIWLAEMYLGHPPFFGEKNSEEHFGAMMAVIGLPPTYMIARSSEKQIYSEAIRYKEHEPFSRPLTKILKGIDYVLLDLICRCLEWDPELRITPEEALRHPFITGQSSENELEEYPILIQRFIGKI
ncbi:dual specificity tyrosine-phosphorylation-regulated kinase 3-like isoform X1 [Styela clava]